MNLFLKGLILSIICLSGCSGNLDTSRFILWCEDPSNGLIKNKSFGDLEFTMMNKPFEYVILKEYRIGGEKEMELKKKELSGLDYYSFKVKTKQGTDPVEYACIYENEKYDRIKYFSFEIDKDLFLISGKDTLPCVLSHCERQPGISPDMIFTLAFPKAKAGQSKEVLFKDRVYNSGPVKFHFEENVLNNIPGIKF